MNNCSLSALIASTSGTLHLKSLSLTVSHLEELFQEIRKKKQITFTHILLIYSRLNSGFKENMSKIRLYEEYCFIRLINFFIFYFFLVFTFSHWRKKKRTKKVVKKFGTANMFRAEHIRCTMLWKNKMGANRWPWDFLCDTLNLVWGRFWASCGHRDLPGSVCSLVQLEHVSLRLLGSWNTLIIGHPSAKCCYQSVISCLWPPPHALL